MKIDLYTKVILTIIALALVGNLLKPGAMPQTAQARIDSKFDHLQHTIIGTCLALQDVARHLAPARPAPLPRASQAQASTPQRAQTR